MHPGTRYIPTQGALSSSEDESAPFLLNVEDDMARVVIDPNPDWKKKLAAFMKELGVIPTNFGGKMEIDWNDGGITVVKLPVTLK